MAGGGARALLLRAAALGGLTAAAWLLGGTDASASPEDQPAVEITTEAPQLLADPAGWAKAFTNSVLERHQAQRLVPAPITKPQEPADEPDDGPVLDFSGGTQGNTRSGTVTNQAPPEVMKAKAQVRAAAKAAKAAAQAPPPAPPAPVVVPVKKIVPKLPDLPVPAPVNTEPTPASDLNWTAPGQDAPLPTPQQAPVVATASASSGHTDNSGGTRGVLAVLTSHNSLFPPSTWSVEQRRDGRSPGSLPGLPSTSPD
ncbi:hypothetical protein ABZ345_04565 [Lentzea sp. NPDC005914]|uniref:hypothetical protein n=1 Tax=Lentzea sp. NPDC005914 TaxID=3154572 RepID=UPI0033C5AAF4